MMFSCHRCVCLVSAQFGLTKNEHQLTARAAVSRTPGDDDEVAKTVAPRAATASSWASKRQIWRPFIRASTSRWT
jgi:hypothetical protein